MNRAYSLLEIKSIDDSGGKRSFTGIASTLSTDRQGDIVDPKGAQFQLPIPFLWQHDNLDPIGWVTNATVTAKNIQVEGEIANFAEAGVLKDRLTLAWQMLKAKLVRGLSIGFMPIKSKPIEGSFGMRFLEFEVLELSAVTIPANAEATITTIKSIDHRQLAASGRGLKGVVLLGHSPGVSGPTVRKDFVTLIPRKYENL